MKCIGHNFYYADMIEYQSEPIPQIILEYVTGIELFDYIAKYDRILTEFQCIQLLKHLVKSVNYLYCKGYVDLDISPENIVVEELPTKRGSLSIKQIDMGLCVPMSEIESYLNKHRISKYLPGKPSYIAPEIYNYVRNPSQPYNWDILQTMVYMIGIVMYTIMSNSSPCGHYGDYWYNYIHSSEWLWDALDSDFDILPGHKRVHLKYIRRYSNSLLSLIDAMIKPLQRRISWTCLIHHMLLYGN